MSWDFSTDDDFRAKLDWMTSFVRDEIEPLDLLWGDQLYRPVTGRLADLVDGLKDRVREQGLWACHLTPELGGHGYGQVRLALMNEIIGRSPWAPIIFGCQAPDTGNAEIISKFGTPEQKAKYLEPLLSGEMFSCYSMTEPQGGSDPKTFTTHAERDGDGWVLNGTKFFSSHARHAEFLVVMAVTNPDVSAYKGMSMFLVPTSTPGVTIVRDIGTKGEPLGEGMHTLIEYRDVRLPADGLLGEEGEAFLIAQTRLSGGRVHHAMRTVGMAQRAHDMMCERALSRSTQGELLATKQLVQSYIADSYLDIQQMRLLVMHTAWLIDQKPPGGVRKEIAAIKVLTPRVLHDVVSRSMQVHGALGVSNEMPLMAMFMRSATMAVVDGPTEVHKITVARQELRSHEATENLWPSEHVPARVEAARLKYAAYDPPAVAHPSFV
jgi:acyl-CoA dehydrogenase